MSGTTGAAAPHAARPALQPLALLLSVGAIAAGAVSLACLIAVVALVILLAREGREGAAEFLLQTQFDLALRTQVGAAAISAFYIGMAGATLAAAALVGRAGWRRLVALSAIPTGLWPIMAISALTLAYGAGLTLALARQQHRPASEGPTDYLLLATLIGNLTLLAPLAEELFFRGWLYTALRARLRFGPSFAFTTVLFAAMHWDANHRRILLVMPLAVALGILREATGSIKPTLALHALYNGLIVAITLLQS